MSGETTEKRKQRNLRKSTVAFTVDPNTYMDFEEKCPRREMSNKIERFMEQYSKHGDNLFNILETTPF